jgi:hypothetical protein
MTMKTFARVLFTMGILTLATGASAQQAPPSLAGTWILQADAAAARNRRPINGISIATRLVIRIAASEVSIDSNTGTANAIVTTTYKVGGGEQAIPGPIGWDTRATSTVDAGKLVVAVRRSVEGPEGALTFDIREVYAVDGDTLTIERTQRRTVQTLVYKRG